MSGVLVQAAPPAVSVTPCWISGLGLWITGTPVFTGGAAATGVAGAAFADPDPQELAAVTATVTEKPGRPRSARRRPGGASDLLATRAVAAQPLVAEPGGAVGPRSVVAVSVRPRIATPLTAGATAERGTGRAWIVSGSLCAVALCPGDVAATTSTMA